jgi:hypothetical protein
MRWGFKGTAVSESGVGGREKTKHEPNTFGATSATALQNAAMESKLIVSMLYKNAILHYFQIILV